MKLFSNVWCWLLIFETDFNCLDIDFLFFNLVLHCLILSSNVWYCLPNVWYCLQIFDIALQDREKICVNNRNTCSCLLSLLYLPVSPCLTRWQSPVSCHAQVLVPGEWHATVRVCWLFPAKTQAPLIECTCCHLIVCLIMISEKRLKRKLKREHERKKRATSNFS